MITRFEEETHELTNQEETLVKLMVIGLSKNIGKEKIITNKQMQQGFKSQGYKVGDARIRKMIHFIRVKGLINNLVSTNKGYYIATDFEDVQEYVQSLTERRNSIDEVINSFKI